jgi:hypothetical protein
MLCTKLGWSQEVFRMRGNFSIKEKSDSLSSLTMGTFYYDKYKKNIVYKITFPKKELWVFADTTVYRFAGDSLVSRDHGVSINEFSIFHLALNNQLADYGLKNSVYKMSNVEVSKGLVISTWSPPDAAKKVLGDVILSTKNKQLQGIVFLNSEGKMMRKQLFQQYDVIQGLSFPTKIFDTFYIENKKTFQVTTYSNITLNESNNANFYDFYLPKQYSFLFSK